MSDKQVVFGLGTGRCGTVTLAGLLSAQPDAEVSHERPGAALTWSGGEAVLDALLDELAASPRRLVGDVGFYYLPYVERIAERFPRARFVGLRRARAATVASYLHKAGDRNHWMRHDGRRWQADRWDACYPKYDAESLEQALGLYWEDYYRRFEHWQQRRPEAFRLFGVEALNDEAGQRGILDFVGVPCEEQVLDVGLRLNDRSVTQVRRPSLFRRLFRRR